METLKEMINGIKKFHADDENFDVVSYLLKHYYVDSYHGQELDYTYFLYFPSMWWELTFWIGQNINGANERSRVSIKELLDKFVLGAKISTYAQRKRIYKHWMMKDKEVDFDFENPDKSLIENKLLKSLYMQFHTLDQRAEVEEALALDVSITELKKQLKRMK